MTAYPTAFGSRDQFSLADGSAATIFRISQIDKLGLADTTKLPFSIRVLLEAALRNHDGFLVRDQDVVALATWSPASEKVEVPFIPARVILQDFTGVPVVVDLAALRDAMVALGGDPKKVNPLVPVDLVIDHSIQVDYSGRYADASSRNIEIEYARNQERYEFLKWGQLNLDNFRAVPPGRGIVHQVNLEWIAQVAFVKNEDGTATYYPDTLVGTDSHTTMINGLGVLGWGVGGIEAEAAMLGQPMYMLLPDVIGFKLTGKLKPGVTATDMTLRITEMLRKKGVVDKFVEYYGDGLASMSLADRATVANMAPEYGATCGFFPVDDATLDYLRLSGRDEEHVKNVEAYYRAQGLFRTAETPDPIYTDTLTLDLSTVEPALAGPKRPQDRINLADMKNDWDKCLTAPIGHKGHGVAADQVDAAVSYTDEGGATHTLKQGAVVIAAITSCTNTSNPGVMIAAGLVARKAVARGVKIAPWVKPSLGPGSRVVTDYYDAAGLTADLDKLGFATVGYGCTTCIGNSGPIDSGIEAAIKQGKLVAASVLSGNRNFEGRVHSAVKANFLASPPLVVAYAIAGTVNIDLQNDAIATDADGNPVYLREIWPTDEEIAATIKAAITPELFRKRYADATSEPRWNAIPAIENDLYAWKESSTYIQLPPFFEGMGLTPDPIKPITGAKVLLKLGDSITTDHISPAGDIEAGGPAGRFLAEAGIAKADFNSFGSRRGNDRIMVRGTFANVRIRNQMAPGTEGGVTRYLPTGEVMAVYDAAQKYKADGTPLIVLAGEQYGTGSSRDWAAKGTFLLGVRAVISKSFERIHRSNLVGMGVLPLNFLPGEDAASLGLDGTETFSIPSLSDDVKPLQQIDVVATKTDGTDFIFKAIVRLDTPVDVNYYRNGGILQTVLRKMAQA
jgi:aconitate hydratase